MNATSFLRNKVILYVSSRYLTYFLQFIASLVIAAKLGPGLLGVWGFYLLIYNYITFINLGIPNSLNILTVQNKENSILAQQIFDSAWKAVLVLCGFIAIYSVFYFYIDWIGVTTINIGANIFIICFIAIVNQINTVYSTIYRVHNKLFEMAFHQSIVPLLLFVVMLLFTGETLLQALLLTYLIGEVLAFVIFRRGRVVKYTNTDTMSSVRLLLTKGAYLFLFNTGFYFIILSTRSIVQGNYSIEEFGYFTFAYTLANSVLLLLQAFTTLIFPKLIDKYKSNDSTEILKVSNLLMNTNVTIAYFLMFVALPVFPVLLHFMPKYTSTITSISFTALAVLMYTNAIYGNYLMAHDKEKRLALIAMIALICNIVFSFLLIKIGNIHYDMVVLAMMFSYFVYSYLVTYYSLKDMNLKTSIHNVIISFFPLRLLVPTIIEIILIANGANTCFLVGNCILFILCNRKALIALFDIAKTIMMRPQIIDINK